MRPLRLQQRNAIRELAQLAGVTRATLSDICRIEPLLRDLAYPSGLCRVSPDVIQFECFVRHRSAVVRALEALCQLRDAADRPVVLYDQTTFVCYFAGYTAEHPPNPSQTRSRLRHAESLPDCVARRLMLQELAPYVRRYNADEPEPETGGQQQLPGVGQQAGAPAPTTTPAPTTDAPAAAPAATAMPAAEPAPPAGVASPATTPAPAAPAPIGRAGVEQLTAQLAGQLDVRARRPAAAEVEALAAWQKETPAAPVLAAFRRHLGGLPQPDDRWRPGRPLHAMLLQRWQQAADAGEAGEWDRYFDFVARRLDVRGCITVAGRPQLVSFEMLLQGQVLRELWAAARDVQRGDTGADPPDSAAA